MRCVGSAGRNTYLPGRAADHGKRPCDAGAVHRNYAAADNKPSEPHRDKGEPDNQGSCRKTCHGVRHETCARSVCRCIRSQSCVHRRMCGNCMCYRGQRVRHAGYGNDGAQLGADVRQRVRGIQEICRDISYELRATGGYLQRA